MAFEKAVTLGNLLSIGTVVVVGVTGSVYLRDGRANSDQQIEQVRGEVRAVRETTSSRIDNVERRQDRDSQSTKDSLTRIEGAVERMNEKLDRAIENHRKQ